MTIENRRLRFVGTGGTLREVSSSLGRLVVEMAEKCSLERGSRDERAETVGIAV
jgi:hypothetical protein